MGQTNERTQSGQLGPVPVDCNQSTELPEVPETATRVSGDIVGGRGAHAAATGIRLTSAAA